MNFVVVLVYTYQRSVMCTQKDVQNRIILINSDILIIHTYFNILEPLLNSYSKFKILIIFILNNTYDVINFDPIQLNIYTKNHKISMICIRTLKYSLKGCVFALLVLFFICCKCLTSKTVNFYK